MRLFEITKSEIFKQSLKSGKTEDEIQIIDKVQELENKYEKFGFDFTYNYGRYLKGENKVAVAFKSDLTNQISSHVYKSLVNDIARDIKRVFDTNQIEWKNAAVDRQGYPVNHWVHGVVQLAESNEQHQLPTEVTEAFMAIADMQRGAPEMAMLRVQRVMGGGVLNPVVEHIGDLTHRMTEHADRGIYLDDIITEKVNRGLRYLTHPYGFEREMKENIRNNNTDTNKLNTLLKQYADEHRKLPVYNAAHWHGREAAIALGEQDWDRAIKSLQTLKQMLDMGVYKRVASSYLMKDNGSLLQYTP